MVNLSAKDGCVAAPSTSRPLRYLRQREKGRSDRAFCIIDGKRHSLGCYGSDESRQRYAELIASTPAKTPTKANDDSQVSGDLTVAELIVSYLAHAERYYRGADGSLSAEYRRPRSCDNASKRCNHAGAMRNVHDVVRGLSAMA